MHSGQVAQPAELLGAAFIDAIRQVVREEVRDAMAMGQQNRGDKYLTVDEAAAVVKCSKFFFYRNPGLPFLVKLGRKTRISSEKLQKWLATR